MQTIQLHENAMHACGSIAIATEKRFEEYDNATRSQGGRFEEHGRPLVKI